MMDRGVTHIVRETFHSSLQLAAELMEALGIPPAEIERDLRPAELFEADELRSKATDPETSAG